MKVMVASNLCIAKVFEPPFELDLHGGSHILQDVLKELARRCRSVQFSHDNGDAGDDVEKILLNGDHYYSLPRGIRTPVNEHDTVMVQISMDPQGGG